MQASTNIVEEEKSGEDGEKQPSILKKAELRGLQASKAGKKSKKGKVEEDDYQVTGYED
jgi:hypothetical protein